MFAVQSNVIRGLTKQQYSMLREMCQYSNNLYNVALYNIRQYFFDNNKYLSYENNYQECRQNENYAMLQAGAAQQILRVADRSFRSFFSLLKKSKNGGYDGKNIRIPHYRKKGGLFNLILSTNSISIKGGKFRIPMSREFMSAHPNIKPIVFPFPERLREKTIKEVRIIPFDNGRHFKIQYVYEVASEEKGLNKDNAIAIDLGVNNLATCVSTVGTPFIMDGRKLKSINHQWNREKARLQSVAKKQGKDITSRINRITEKRNNRVGRQPDISLITALHRISDPFMSDIIPILNNRRIWEIQTTRISFRFHSDSSGSSFLFSAGNTVLITSNRRNPTLQKAASWIVMNCLCMIRSSKLVVNSAVNEYTAVCI